MAWLHRFALFAAAVGLPVAGYLASAAWFQALVLGLLVLLIVQVNGCWRLIMIELVRSRKDG